MGEAYVHRSKPSAHLRPLTDGQRRDAPSKVEGPETVFEMCHSAHFWRNASPVFRQSSKNVFCSAYWTKDEDTKHANGEETRSSPH